MLAVIIILLLQVFGLGVALAKHGKPMKGKESFFVSLLSVATFWVCVWWLDCPIFS
jgi:hypothetical protein